MTHPFLGVYANFASNNPSLNFNDAAIDVKRLKLLQQSLFWEPA